MNNTTEFDRDLCDTEKAALKTRSAAELETYKLHRRFDRLGRLIGDEKVKKLMKSHVMVVGLGGVGSWAAESLARSGIGKLTIIDFDEVCITNTNRQLHAVSGVVGKKKAELMAERLKKINPNIEVVALDLFYNAENSDAAFSDKPDYVIDAIDNVTAKCHLINRCQQEQIPIVCSTGSGGRMDPTSVTVSDLADTEVDSLARSIRKILRQQYNFPRKGKFKVKAVYSTEPPFEPSELHYDQGKGFTCVCPTSENYLHSCDQRNIIWGTASFVTSVFGMVCTSIVVRDLIEGVGPELKRYSGNEAGFGSVKCHD